MVYKIIWTDPAITDLKAICEYIAEEDHDAAECLVMGIIEHAEEIEYFPKRGKIYKKRAQEGVHELAYRGYRIFYVVFEDVNRVDILHVWHGAREEPEI